jgi:virulence-associated protein VagC
MDHRGWRAPGDDLRIFLAEFASTRPQTEIPTQIEAMIYPATGDVILSRRPESWEDFFELMRGIDVPSDFLAERDDTPPQKRKLF